MVSALPFLSPAIDASRVPARREYKYLLPRRLLPALRESLAGICARDAYAGADGTYRIRSLYFDTFDLRLVQATERDAPERYNARVRHYPDAPQAPVMAEIKARRGDTIKKSRGLLAPSAWVAAVRTGRTTGPSSSAVDNFLTRVHLHDLRPVVLVQYRREAWASSLDEYARVSVDTEIVCARQERLCLDPALPWRPVDTPLPTWTPESICVLELKFADRAPRWMVDLVQRLELLRHSFSKYSYSMLALASEHSVGLRDTASPWGLR